MAEVTEEQLIELLATQSPATHNGVFTITSVRTGDHRTFRIKTQGDESRFAAGKRVVSVLTGPDNTRNYTKFAFYEGDRVVVWSRYKGTKFEEYAEMLTELRAHLDAGRVTCLASVRCRVCNRDLTTPVSILTGIGPICGGRA